MLRCYGRPVVGWTEAKQRDLFAQHGVKSRDGAPIYFDTAGTFPRQRKAVTASLRAGVKDELGVARLYVLASSRKDLREVLAAIKSKGATIRELATGRVLHPDDCADAILDAATRISLLELTAGLRHSAQLAWGRAMVKKDNDEAVRKAVIELVGRSSTGRPAADLVFRLVREHKAQPNTVRRELRRLLERGELAVGPTMNLIIGLPKKTARIG